MPEICCGCKELKLNNDEERIMIGRYFFCKKCAMEIVYAVEHKKIEPKVKEEKSKYTKFKNNKNNFVITSNTDSINGLELVEKEEKSCENCADCPCEELKNATCKGFSNWEPKEKVKEEKSCSTCVSFDGAECHNHEWTGTICEGKSEWHKDYKGKSFDIRAEVKEYEYRSVKDDKLDKEYHVLYYKNGEYYSCLVCDTKEEAKEIARRINEPNRIIGIIANMLEGLDGVARSEKIEGYINALQELKSRIAGGKEDGE